MVICIYDVEQKTDSVTLTLAKLSSLLVKRPVKLYKDFMRSLTATKLVPFVAGKVSVLLKLL